MMQQVESAAPAGTRACSGQCATCPCLRALADMPQPTPQAAAVRPRAPVRLALGPARA